MESRAEVLLGLHDSLAHKGQEEAWQADLVAFEELKADDEAELRRVRKDAYQVAGLYLMFQGFIFTAVSQPKLLNCALSWCPVSLSLAVSLATILAIADKLYSMGELREDINESDHFISVLQEGLDSIDSHGSGLDLDSAKLEQKIPRRERAGLRFVVGSRDGVFALLFLMGFSLLVAIFSVKALCRRR